MNKKILATLILAIGVIGVVAGCGQKPQPVKNNPNLPPVSQAQKNQLPPDAPKGAILASKFDVLPKTVDQIPSAYPMYTPNGKPDTVKPKVENNLLVAGPNAYSMQFSTVIGKSESKSQIQTAIKALDFNASAVSFSVDGKNVVVHMATGFPLFGVHFFVNGKQVSGNTFSAPSVEVELKYGQDTLQMPPVSNAKGVLEGAKFNVPAQKK